MLFAFSACEKDETQATLTPSNSPTLRASTNSVVLTQANAAQTAITYTWTPISSFSWQNASSEYQPAVTYTIQLDRQGNNFASPANISAGNGPTTALTVEALNTSLNTLGLAPGTATPLEARLRASYAANAPLYSEVLPLTATAYRVCVAPRDASGAEIVWSIIGPAGVDWDTDVVLTYDCDTRTYGTTRALNAGEFKFRRNRDWGTNYGDDGADGALELNGANITVAAAGNYTIKLDLNATPKPTFTLTRR
ncbi:hypothetical protein B0919_23185 [Hymenobacter sp. CRA2]|nr:hypothetical protein B0919_23185 [Hymenobacter sp. CRA2]